MFISLVSKKSSQQEITVKEQTITSEIKTVYIHGRNCGWRKVKTETVSLTMLTNTNTTEANFFKED